MNKSDLINALFSSLGAFLCIGLLAYLNSFFKDALWLIPPFGASMVLVMAAHTSPFAQPKNIFFGHLLTSLVGMICLYTFTLPSFISIPLAVGLGVGFMILFNVTHPPAGGNPVIIILGSVSYDYLFSPIITGTIIILLFGVIINKYILKKNYPK